MRAAFFRRKVVRDATGGGCLSYHHLLATYDVDAAPSGPTAEAASVDAVPFVGGRHRGCGNAVERNLF